MLSVRESLVLWTHFSCSLHTYSSHYIVLYTQERTMRQAALTDLHINAKLYFDYVEAGESARVLRNGKPIADIVPIAPELPS